jgi:hypothetical protein
VSALLAAVVPAGHAVALERPSEFTVLAIEQSSGPLKGGLYVIGDSISQGVPYVETAASVGANAWVRAHPGWAIQSHRHRTEWSNHLDSFSDAAASDASTVFVQLGTNDAWCLRWAGGACAQFGTVPDDNPGYPDFAYREKLAIVIEMKAAIDTLLAAGKCVIWAGPREINTAAAYAEDFRFFNDWIKGLANQYPGSLFYAGYHEFANGNPDLRDDLALGDPIHPDTAAGRQAIASLVVYEAQGLCHMD